MKRIAWAAVLMGIFALNSTRAQDQGQQTRPGPKPPTPGEPYRGNPRGPLQPQGGRPEGPVGPSFNHGSSSWGGRTFNRKTYQGNWTASRRYHNGAYVPPSGWYYRRWAYGQTFPPRFWTRNYWITSWADFGLMVPPFGYQWVRYGSDALLIDTGTGQILQVQYGVFY